MMKNKHISLFLSVAMLLISAMSWAQTQVKGTVVDAASGEPIIGANIIEKGTTNGTISDFDGNFTLSVQAGAVLQISYMGYKTQELAAAAVMNVRLGEDTELIDEVVVVGYGVVKKNDATGSVTAIKPDDMNKGLTTTATDMLSGKVAGVNVTSNDGTPGGGATIRIRGGSSLSASNDPLIVIDGLAMDNDGIKGVSNPLSMVNPNDIETFTVLKDASATAIYGSRASNGVILITTKKGAAGQKMKVTYSGNVSMGVPLARVDVLTADELRAYAKKVGVDQQYINLMGNANTDWQSEIYRMAPSTDHNFTFAGGTKNMPYRASIGYTLNDGIKKSSQMQRVTAALNLNPSFLDNHLKFNLNAKGMYIFNQYADGVEGSALDLDPSQPIRSEDSQYIGFGGYYQRTATGAYEDSDPTWALTKNSQSTGNPVAALDKNIKDNHAHSGAFVGNLEADYAIHGLEDLHLHANFGADYSYGNQIQAISPYSFSNHYYGWNEWSKEHKYNLQFNCYAQYGHDWEKAQQHFDAMVGYEWQHFKKWGEWAGQGAYRETSLKMDEAGNSLAGQPYNAQGSPWASESYLVSFFGRVNWVGWNQVMLTATVRGDGSSRFAPGKKWGLFPSVALGWKIKETFFKDNTDLSEWKLRLGYGITGQQNINQGDYPYLPTYTISKEHVNYTLGEVDANGNYIYYGSWRPNVYSSDLTWEKTTTFNVGMDFGFLNQRVTFALDYYFRNTTDLINEVDIPAGTNFKTRAVKNVGSLHNQGLEFMFNAVAIDRKNLKWDLGFNATWNTNQITKLITGDGEGYYINAGGINDGQYVQAHAVGHAASSFYIFQTAKHPTSGEVYIIDQQHPEALPSDADYEITAEKDKIFYHSPAPDVTLGLTSKWQFYNFDIGISFRAALGNYVYNQVLAGNLQNVLANQVYDSKCGGWHNLQQNAIDAYESGFIRGNLKYPDQTDYFVENASFLRCDNITLGYTFTQNPKVNARLYATVSNPFVITGYRGLDPEVVGGVDNNIYPRSMNVIIGTTVTF
ncbi:MAG: SusC/RagA family TonB-linked outer membrane protein [Paludibacteraceae bacterium]|nr:SusC/RagA family TonB-linked outer membrane protein [Paludibacteraceae bacterium]